MQDIGIDLLKQKCPQVRDAYFEGKFLAVSIKTNFFKLEPKKILPVLNYLDEQGFDLVTEIGIDGNKFIFKRREIK
jgi:hypothetical protein